MLRTKLCTFGGLVIDAHGIVRIYFDDYLEQFLRCMLETGVLLWWLAFLNLIGELRVTKIMATDIQWLGT